MLKPEKMEKILIKGMGIVSAIGDNVEQTLLSLRENRSGIGTLRYLNSEHTEFPVGEVKMTNQQMAALLNIPPSALTTRTSLMGMLAVRQALQMAGIDYQAHGSEHGKNLMLNAKRVAFVNGTTVGGMDMSEQFYLDFLENDSKNAYLAAHDAGACTEMIADYFGIFSQLDTISTACSSAANAIMLGAELLKTHRADIVVAGGAECITKFHLNGFNSLMILDKQPCRPFYANRAGLNLGEGAAYVVMERSIEHNGALAALSGYGNACDAYHQTASSPDGEGAVLAMQQALQTANLMPSDIDYINAHGTGTQNNDISEGRAIVRLFGNTIPNVSSTKSLTGHTTSAAGGVEAVISILALQHGFIPATDVRSILIDSEFSNEHEVVSNDHQVMTNEHGKKLKNIMSNSFGFGGNNTSLIFSNP